MQLKVTTTFTAALVSVGLMNLIFGAATFSDDLAAKLPSWLQKGESPDFSAMQRAMNQHPVGNPAFSSTTSSTMPHQMQQRTSKSAPSVGSKVEGYERKAGTKKGAAADDTQQVPGYTKKDGTKVTLDC